MARPMCGRISMMCRSAADETLEPVPRRAGDDGGALSAGQGRSGTGCALQCGGKILSGLCGRHRQRSGPAHLACGHRPAAHDGRRPEHLFSAARPAPCRSAGRLERSRHSSSVFPPTAASAPRSMSIAWTSWRASRPKLRMRNPRAQLSGLPSERQPCRAGPGRSRNRHGDHGLRQGYRRAYRRAAIAVQRFSAWAMPRASPAIPTHRM